MDSTGVRLKKYSSRESHFINETFEFLGSEEKEDIVDGSHVTHNGSPCCVDARDEQPQLGCSSGETFSGSHEERQRGGNVKGILRRRASNKPSSENSSESGGNKKHSCESMVINDAFVFLQEETTRESSMPNEGENTHTQMSGQCPPLRKYSSRESQFVSETFDFLADEDQEEDSGTSPAVDNSKSDTRSARKYSSRESQFVSETFEFLGSSDDEAVADSASNKPTMTKDKQPPPARKHSSRESQFISETFEFLSSDEKEDISDTASVPVGGSTVDNCTEASTGCTHRGDDTNSILRRKSRKGRSSRRLESINSSDDDITNKTESAIVKLALKRVGEFSEEKFLVDYDNDDSEDTEGENCEEYDSGLQGSGTGEEYSSIRTSSEVSDDKDVGDDLSVRTSSDVSDGGVSNSLAPARVKAVRQTKRMDSTSTTASEAEFRDMSMSSQGSLRKRLVHHQSSVCTYQRRTVSGGGSTEVEKVVDLIKEEGDSGFGFHLIGSGPVVISTIEPGSCAARAGLNVGDALITMGGRSIAAASVDEVVEIIKQNHDKVTLGVRQESLPFDRTVCCGYMTKQGGKGVFKNWKRRWFNLKADHCLYYYKSQQDTEPVGAIVLSGYTVSRAPEVNRKHTFKLYKYGLRTYYFQADSSKDMNRWAGVLANMATTTAKKDPWLDVNAHNVGLAALAIKDPECHGFLTKLGGRVKTWKRRYCVLKDACLYYYTDVNSHTAQGIVHLHGFYVLETSQQGKKFGFTLLAPETNMRTFHFYAENQTDCTRWLNALKSSIGKWVKEEEAR